MCSFIPNIAALFKLRIMKYVILGLIGFILCMFGAYYLGVYEGKHREKPKPVTPEIATKAILRLYSERKHLPDSCILGIELNANQVYLIRYFDPIQGFEGMGVYMKKLD